MPAHCQFSSYFSLTHTHTMHNACSPASASHSTLLTFLSKSKCNNLSFKLEMRLKSTVCMRERGLLSGNTDANKWHPLAFCSEWSFKGTKDWVQFSNSNIQQSSCTFRFLWVYNNTKLGFFSAFQQDLRKKDKALCYNKGGRMSINLE